MPRTKHLDRRYVLLEDGQTPVTAAEVADRLQNGSSLDVEANNLDVSASHLRAWLKRNGFVPHHPPPVWFDKNQQYDPERDDINRIIQADAE